MDIIPYVSVVKWADGTGIAVPPLTRGKNGWVKPYGKRKFGRGQEGVANAQQWQYSLLNNAFQEHNWEVPEAINTPLTKGRADALSSKGLHIEWIHPVFGYTGLTYDLSGSRYNKFVISANLTCHRLVWDLTYRSIGNGLIRRSDSINLSHRDEDGNKSETFDATSATDALQKVVANPEQSFRKLFPAEAQLLVTPDFETAEWTFEHATTDELITEGIRTSATGGADLYVHNRADSIIFDNLDVVDRVFQAFAHKGVNITRYMTGYGRNQTLSELVIVIPSLSDEGRPRESHRFHLTVDRGVKVTCQYEQDEARYLAYQQRVAADFYRELVGDQPAEPDPGFSEYEIQVERNQ